MERRIARLIVLLPVYCRWTTVRLPLSSVVLSFTDTLPQYLIRRTT